MAFTGNYIVSRQFRSVKLKNGRVGEEGLTVGNEVIIK